MKILRVRFPASRSRGFSLVELLVVLVIIVIMSALAFAAFTSLGKADNFNNATSTLSTLLEQARAYAMANNTYVFVGIQETDASQPASGTQSAGIGRVAIQAFASQDGTLNLTAGNLTAINRLQIMNNVDIPQSLTTTSVALSNRPSADYNWGSNTFPVSSNIISRNFTFSKVIAFNSLGTVSIPSTPSVTGMQYLEIDLQPSNGNVVPASPKNVGAIQLDATTGIVNIYRS